MADSKSRKKHLLVQGINVLLPVVILFFVLHADAKVWLLKQLMAVGLFTAEIKKGNKADSLSPNTLNFSFKEENGSVVSTNDLKGKVVFINFWATWCPPCRAEMPSLNRLYHTFKQDNRFVFLFISEDDDFAKAKAYLQASGFNLPLAFRTGTVPPAFFSGTLPTTVVLDTKGKIVMKKEGIAAYDTQSFITQLKELL